MIDNHDDQECDWCRDCNKPWGTGDCSACRYVADYNRSREESDTASIIGKEDQAG